MTKLKEYIQQNKTRVLFLTAVFLILAAGLVFVKNDAFLYSQPIVKIDAVSETEHLEFGEEVPRITQQVTATVENGSGKGTVVSFTNERLASGLKCFDIRPGDEYFVTASSDYSEIEPAELKRDFTVALLLAVCCFLMCLISSKDSLRVLISSLINVGIFALMIYLRFRLIDILVLFITGTVLFTVTTLPIVAGVNKKTLAAVISTLASVGVMMLIAAIVIRQMENYLYFETIEYLCELYDYKSVFYSSLLISGLGAIMDTSIIMATAINELIEKDPGIASKELLYSAREIAKDITGTITNVLLFSCVIGTLPSIVYLVCNGVSAAFAIEYFASIEIIRALTGCIGIVLAVPLSCAVNLTLRRRRSA